MNGFTSFKRETLAAGQVVTHNVTGSLFLCKESDRQFLVAPSGRESFPMECGLGFRLPNGDKFTNLTFKNDNPDAVTFEYYAGSSEVLDNRLNSLIGRTIAIGMLAAATRIQPNGGTAGDDFVTSGGTTLTLAAGDKLALAGTDANGFRRKQIVVTNLSTSLDLKLQKAALSGRTFATVFPRTAWTMETSAQITLFNPDLSNTLECEVCETFYTETADVTA